jgi:hypothetical protein
MRKEGSPVESAASLVAAVAATLFVAPSALPAPGLFVGTADDAALVTDFVAAKTELRVARAAGLRAVRLTVIWAPGQTEASREDLQRLDNAVAAADLSGTRVLFQVRPWGGRTAPRMAVVRSSPRMRPRSRGATGP